MCAGTLTMTTQTQTQTIQNGARVLRLRIQGNLQNQQQSLLPLRLRQREHSEVDTNNSSDNERAKIRRIEAQQQQEHQEEQISYTPEQISGIRAQYFELNVNDINQREQNQLSDQDNNENDEDQVFRFDEEFGDDFDDNGYFIRYPNHPNPRFRRDIASQLASVSSSNILTRRMVNDVIDLLADPDQPLETSARQIQVLRMIRNGRQPNPQVIPNAQEIIQNMPAALEALNDEQLFVLMGAILHERNVTDHPQVLEEEKERKFAEPTAVVPPKL